MTYLRMNGTNTTVTLPATGTVISSTQLNVRAAAGTGNAIVGRLAPGSVITVYELTNVNGVAWGRTSAGWVCMQYVRLTGSTTTNPTTPTNPGVVWQ